MVYAQRAHTRGSRTNTVVGREERNTLADKCKTMVAMASKVNGSEAFVCQREARARTIKRRNFVDLQNIHNTYTVKRAAALERCVKSERSRVTCACEA